MPRTRKNNRKSNPRGATAARTAQPRARRDGEQAAPSGPPTQEPSPLSAQAPGPKSSSNVPPGLRPAQAPGPKSASNVPPGLRSAKNSPRDLVPGMSEDAKVVPALASPPDLAPVRPRDKKAEESPAGAGSGTPPASTSDGLPGWAAKAVEELLTVTYWLDPGEQGDPFTATIRFSGRRAGVTRKPQPGDTFWQEETVEGIVPGSGPVAVTAEVRGVNSGEWTVTARPVARVSRSPYRPYPPPGDGQPGARRVPWPRRVVIPADPEATVHTASVLRAKVPGIVRFAYASLVTLGVLTGLGLEALLLTHGHYALFRPVLFSVIAIVAGVIGGKAWYIAVHRGRKFDGWCIQGFVAGAAVVVAAAAIAGPGIPAGAFLAAAAPALLIGMAIGRLGCFWAGCCTGRPTASRRGIWSSDRRVGCRREPAQLLEALAALISGLAVLAVVLAEGLARSGPVAVIGLAVYTLCRQFILGLRAEPRVWQYGRWVTAAAAAIALIAGVVLLARG